MRKSHGVAVALAAAAIMLSPNRPASATTYNWNIGSGNWDFALHWSPFGIPGSGDTVNIGPFGDGVARTVTYDYTGAAVTLNSLTIDLTGPGATTTTLSMSADNLTSSTEYVGSTGRGSFNQSGGTNTIAAGTGFLDVGVFAGSTGTYSLSGTGALVVNTNEYIGDIGTGVFNQTGGTNTIAGSTGNLYLGYNASGASGTYTLSAGSLSVNAGEYVGYSVPGSFIQSGGTNTISNGILFLGNNAGSTGTYTLSAGSLTTNGYEYVGFNGAGSFNQSRGTNTVSSGYGLYLGYNAGSMGTYSLSGTGALVANAGEHVGYGGMGTFTQSGGSNMAFSDAFGNSLYLGDGVGITGIYNLSGGSVSANGYELVGYNGTGTFTQSGGTNSLSGTNSINGTINPLFLGYNTGSNGTYTLSGTGILLAAGGGGEFVGYRGTGNFIQTGGTNTIGSGGVLNLGGYANTTGTYTLSGGSLALVSGFETVGNSGTGVFNQSGGTNSIGTGELAIGLLSGGTGTYTLSGGSTAVGGNVYVGSGIGLGPGGTGVLNVSGLGVLTVGGTLIVYNTPGTVINLSGGTINAASLNFNGVPSLLNWTSGTLNITSDVTWDSAADSTTTSAAFGSALALGPGQTLMVTGDEGLGGTGFFALTLNSGGTHLVNGHITINPAGVLTINPGSGLYYYGLTQAGGIINGNLINRGAFAYQSGTFNGRLINLGTVDFGVGFSPSNGMENDSAVTLVGGFTVNGAGLDNFGTFTLGAGIISGSAQVVNDFGGTLSGFGTVNPLVTNYGILSPNGTMLFPGGVSNNGIIQGTGLISGPVANNAGGLIQAKLSTPLTFNSFQGNNPGGSMTIAAGSILEIANAWTNAGLATLQGSDAVLGGGGAITNTGTIQGAGLVSPAILNTSGAIRASGGELDLAGTGTTNASAAQIQSGAGSTVVVLQGLATNAGTIALSGGTFDNDNNPITNAATGFIIGSGTFLSGGLTNHGIVRFADNPTSVYGSVTTASPGSIVNLINNTTTFYGPVTIAADSSLVASNATARFLAGVTGSVTPGVVNNGAASFAGANAVYGTVVNAGAVTVGGASSVVFHNQFFGSGSIANGGVTIFVTGSTAPDTIGGILNNNAFSSLIVEGNGTLEIDAAPALGNSSSISVNDTSRLKFNIVTGSATIGAGVTATVASGATLELAGSVSALSTGTNRVNITNNSAAPGIVVSGTHQQVGNIDGLGTTQVNAGSDLTANHIIQSALVIGGTAASAGAVTIAPSDASGNPLATFSSDGLDEQNSAGPILADSLSPSSPFAAGDNSLSALMNVAVDSSDLAVPAIGNSVAFGSPLPVPEPSTLLLALLAVLAVIGTQFARHHLRWQTV